MAREIELGSSLNTLSRMVFKAFAEKMLPLTYDPDAFYTVEQFKHIEKERNILCAFARDLGLEDHVGAERSSGTADREGDVVSLKNEIVKELVRRGKLAKKGSQEEEEAKREAVKPILETLMVLDTVLRDYGGRDILHQVMPSQMPQPMINPIDLFSYAGGVCVCFLQALNEGKNGGSSSSSFSSSSSATRPLNVTLQQKAMEDARESVEQKVLSQRAAKVFTMRGTLVDILGSGNQKPYLPSLPSSSSMASPATTLKSAHPLQQQRQQVTQHHRHLHHHRQHHLHQESHSMDSLYVSCTSSANPSLAAAAAALSSTPSSDTPPTCCGRPTLQIVPPWSRRANGSRH
jgi:hypothetical protein